MRSEFRGARHAMSRTAERTPRELALAKKAELDATWRKKAERVAQDLLAYLEKELSDEHSSLRRQIHKRASKGQFNISFEPDDLDDSCWSISIEALFYSTPFRLLRILNRCAELWYRGSLEDWRFVQNAVESRWPGAGATPYRVRLLDHLNYLYIEW